MILFVGEGGVGGVAGEAKAPWGPRFPANYINIDRY